MILCLRSVSSRLFPRHHFLLHTTGGTCTAHPAGNFASCRYVGTWPLPQFLAIWLILLLVVGTSLRRCWHQQRVNFVVKRHSFSRFNKWLILEHLVRILTCPWWPSSQSSTCLLCFLQSDPSSSSCPVHERVSHFSSRIGRLCWDSLSTGAIL